MASLCQSCGNQVDENGNCQPCMLQLGMSDYAAKPQPPGMAPLPSIHELNDQFSQLQITRLIGRGGMGAIYHARQTHLDRDVALKVIAREVADDAAFIERFEREAKTLAKLSHPNIVTIYDYGRTEDGQAYLVMEYVDGINLREAMETQSVGSDDALEIVSAICGALEYAHSKGIVHRDIKPENILLGEDGTLKVADFGIAKIVDDSVRTPTLTATRQVLGSLHYLAPEHLEAPEQVDHRVDLYALGVVFYELLTGQLPLGRYEPPSQLGQMDYRLDSVVLKTLNRKPAQRYQSARELRTDLGQFEFGQSIPDAEVVQDSSYGRAASVPFTCEAMGGFAEAVGIIHAKPDSMVIEYRVRDAIWGTVKSQTNTVDIPISKLTRVEVLSGLFSCKIAILAETIAVLDNLPNAETGRVELVIKRADYHLAQRVVETLGFADPASAPAPRETPIAASASDADGSRWTTLGVLLVFLGIVNAGVLGVIEFINAEELRDIEFVMATVLAAVIMGPLALLQIVTGLLCLIARPISLARATAIVSMLPLAPSWIVGGPVGLWSFLWLRKATKKPRGIDVPKEKKPGWGATTMMYIRESRWSKTVAGLNMGALALVAIAFGVYKVGWYPVELQYRIVDRESSPSPVIRSAEQRLNGLGKARFQANEERFSSDRFWIRCTAYNRQQIVDAFQIESPIQLCWLPQQSDGVAEVDTDAETTLVSLSGKYDVASGLNVGSALRDESNTGMTVQPSTEPVEIQGSHVSRISRTGTHGLQLELTSSGKKLLDAEAGQNAGMAMVADGMVIGFASNEQINGRKIQFSLAHGTEFTRGAIQAAIRGPAIPTALELID